MDPITQGALGAATAQLALGQRLGRRTWLLGALGGMAADLDIFIRSSTDPLVGIVYHRHFTHSLAFVPVGGLVVALPWLLRRREAGQRRAIAAATTIGYATHALLDCCTSYGTMYWWPFSDERVAWSFISIIDPLYTLPLLFGVFFTAMRGRRRPVAIGFAIAHVYMALCGIQKLRALALRDRLAEERGHVVERAMVQNLMASNIGWRSLYEFDGRIWADAIYTPLSGPAVVREGQSAALGSVEDLPATLRRPGRPLEAYRTFVWFASGWVVVGRENDRLVVCDVRYSTDPGGFASFWCTGLSDNEDTPVERLDRTGSARDAGRFLEASFSPPSEARPVE
jgi:inner membrane protein